ncbi:MAG: S41 family peptidase [Selenomonas sp.]|nr:S41 family peptidase [Selenomonas sp.]
MNKKRLAAVIVITALISSLLTMGAWVALLGLDSHKVVDLVRFFGTMRLIETRYVDGTDEGKLLDGAISGMVQSLGDPHSIYMDKDLYTKLMEHTEGAFGGIGVTMGFKDDKVTIISVLEGTPGEKAGLLAGDEIMAVDGTSVAELQPEEVVLGIRGEVGTQVALTIHREGQEDTDYQLTRDTIHVPSVKGLKLEGTDLGYIRIASFAENTGKEFKEEFKKVKDEGARGLVIDLRQNPGGLITSCVEVAREVVPKGTIVSVVDKNGAKEEYASELEASQIPIVVLMDGGSASASEILAGALQDTGAGKVVGVQSYGKGSVQIVVPLMNEDGLKLTVAKYYTPSGRSIDGTGITPDVEAALVPESGVDSQLEKAKEVLKQELGEPL